MPKKRTFKFFVGKVKNFRTSGGYKQKTFGGPGFDRTAGQQWRRLKLKAKGKAANLIATGTGIGIAAVGIGEGVRRSRSNNKPKKRR